MYAVKHVNLMDTHIPPMKNASHARTVEVLEAIRFSFFESKTWINFKNKFQLRQLSLVVNLPLVERYRYYFDTLRRTQPTGLTSANDRESIKVSRELLYVRMSV